MANDKKSPNEAAKLFEGIIKASVSGNPKPKGKKNYFMTPEKLLNLGYLPMDKRYFYQNPNDLTHTIKLQGGKLHINTDSKNAGAVLEIMKKLDSQLKEE
jgi:hypothetical protein